MRVDWLPDVLRDAGCGVYVMPGALTRGRSMKAVHGVVWHHTASGPNWNDDHVAFLLRDGRRDLAGPLAQLGLERDGNFVVVATGRANHNGYGEWGNDSIGIEAYNNGVGEPWAPPQVEAYERGTAAILKHLGLSTGRMKGHRETDPGRKIDPAGLDMNHERSTVAKLMKAGLDRNPVPTMPDPKEESMNFFVQANDPAVDNEPRTIINFCDEEYRVLTGQGYEDRKALRRQLGLKTLPLVQWHPLQILQHIERYQLQEIPAMVKR